MNRVSGIRPIENRGRNLTAVIGAISVVGVTFGLTMPLTTLVLKSWGASETVIGANAAMPALSVIFFSPFIPAMSRRIGMRRFLHICMGVLILSMFAFPLLPNIPAWFVIRMIYGAAATGLFVVSEVWINELAEDHRRGRIIGVYSVALSAGYVAGAVLVSEVGIEGWRPFLMGAALTAAGGLLLIPATESASVAGDASPPHDMIHYVRLAPVPIIAVVTMGLLYTGVTALLPAYGVMSGLDNREAALTVAWLGAGEMIIPLATGLLADRYRNDRLIFGIMLLAAGALWVLPHLFAIVVARNLLLLWIGGAMVSLYALGLTMLGRRFSGAALAMANATFVFSFGIGELAGPVIAGTSMDLVSQDGFSYSMAACATLAGIMIFALISRSARNEDG